MPFIVPTLLLLNRAKINQYNNLKRIQFLKNFFYFRVSSYISFFIINQVI